MTRAKGGEGCQCVIRDADLFAVIAKGRLTLPVPRRASRIMNDRPEQDDHAEADKQKPETDAQKKETPLINTPEETQRQE